ncbi:glycosyltransferase [Lentibacillus salicampi]|uniref:Glycosyltransferase n=2 Tax=Lentibacillus salicampi TaxID=175306 RepID=A0A4Y9A8K5_9BACI|nr:glycosyltransferase [Lentibacillus salicampi]
MDGEKDVDRLRKAAIIKAECHDLLGESEKAKHVINAALEMKHHRDLFLAYANLEETVEKKTEWINKTLKAYGLQPVYFAADTEGAAKPSQSNTNSCESSIKTCDADPKTSENVTHSSQNSTKTSESFTGLSKSITYDDLTTKPMDKQIENGPKVSVILPAYNAEDGISTAIESILSQTWQNIELLVVDDCSSDNTKDVVRDHMKQDSRITLMFTPVNSGPYIARNIALKAATGEFVTVNDSDDWSHAEKIEIQAKHLQHNKNIIANTSEHARLTEDLTFYRRGTPGHYIFSNMSSLMFRRKPVLKKLGYWNSVRFAADGEFKRRLINVFGKQTVVDLKTGPLSLPRQSVTSLTGSSAFGYSGFFKGVRKEYVESFEYYHTRADSLYYPAEQSNRLFPVPEPMWPTPEPKHNGSRHFDIVVAADFRSPTDQLNETIGEIQTHNEMGLRTGLVQMAEYNLNAAKTVNADVRKLIDGKNVQMLVFGESITCDILLIKNPSILQEQQHYIPDMAPGAVLAIIEQPLADLRTCSRRLTAYFDKKGKWYPKNQAIRGILETDKANGLRFIKLANDNWPAIHAEGDTAYGEFLANWLVDANPYIYERFSSC